MNLESVLKEIDFVIRYKKVCEYHDDFENSMRGNHKKEVLQILEKYDSDIQYIAKERVFKTVFNSSNGYQLELILTVRDGLVEAHLNFLKGQDWLSFNRLDGHAENVDSNFDREKFNIPKYCSLEEI